MNAEHGYLKVIIGPMYSGKSSEIIKLYKYNQIAQITTLVVNYDEDERYDKTKLSTHDKIMIPCLKLHKSIDILTYPELSEIKSVIIDEAQFFDDLYITTVKLLELNKTIYVCGLDGDFQMKKFGHILDIIPLADEVDKKQALCAICRNGKKAPFTKRLSSENMQKLIGSDNYLPVCRMCHQIDTSDSSSDRLTITIPPGLNPGETIAVRDPSTGKQYSVTIPANAKPGHTVQVTVS